MATRRGPAALEAELEKIYTKFSQNPAVSEPSFTVQNEAASVDCSFASDKSQPFLAASITKLLTSVLLLKLEETGRLGLSDSLGKYLSESELAGLVVDSNQEIAGSITLLKLATNRSGIADYYRLKTLDPKSDIPELTRQDPGWSFQEVLDLAKSLPNELSKVSKRASYSFTNFQILSEVLERATGSKLSELFAEHIFSPAAMSQSTLLTKLSLGKFSESAPILYGTQSYLGASRIASLRGEGALISTNTDLVSFMRKLEEGSLVSKASVARMRNTTAKLFPLVHYGLGTMKLEIPGPLMGRIRPVVLYGHLGATGSFAFQHPETDSYFSGTVNQIGNRTLGTKLLFEIVSKTLRHL